MIIISYIFCTHHRRFFASIPHSYDHTLNWNDYYNLETRVKKELRFYHSLATSPNRGLTVALSLA